MTEALSIRPVTAADVGPWDAFVADHPHGTPFHLLGWSRAVGEGLGHRPRHLLAESGGRIRAVFPLVEVRSPLTGHRLVSTPLAGYGGPLGTDAVAVDALLGHVRRLTREIGAGHLEIHWESDERVPLAARGLPAGECHCGFRETLPEYPGDLESWLPRKSRRMVRLGRKAGLEGRSHRLDVALEDPHWLIAAHHLVAATMRDLGTPSYGLPMLRQLLAEDPDRWFVWALRDADGDLAAAVWVARMGRVLYPHFSGADIAYRKVGVNNLLYASLMEEGIRTGARVFDFGRSKIDSGPYHFKRHLGFEPRSLGYRFDLVRGEAPGSVSANDPRFALAIQLWQRLPLPVTRTLGPSLVSHFV